MAAPVISAPASETRNAAMLATCSVCTHLEGSAPGLALRLASVFMVPGRMVFAVMPACLFSIAAVRISATNAAFEVL